MPTASKFNLVRLQQLKKSTNVARIFLILLTTLQMIFLRTSFDVSIGTLMDICDQFDVTISQVTWINSIRMSIALFAGVIITQFWRCLSRLMVHVVACLLLVAGVVCTVLTPSMSRPGFYAMYVTLGLLPGLAWNLVYMTVILQATDRMPWQNQKRKMIQLMTWYCCVDLLATSCSWGVISRLLPTYLWRGSLLLCAGVTLNMIPNAMAIKVLSKVCVQRGGGHSSSRNPEATFNPNPGASLMTMIGSAATFDVHKQNLWQDFAAHLRLMRAPNVLCFVLGRACVSGAFYGSFFLLPRFYRDFVRFNSSQSSLFLSIEAALCTVFTCLFSVLFGFLSVRQFYRVLIAFSVIPLITTGSFLVLQRTSESATSDELRTKTIVITVFAVLNGIGKTVINLFYPLGVSLVKPSHSVHVLYASGIVTGASLLLFSETLAQVYMLTQSFRASFGIVFVLNALTFVFTVMAIKFTKVPSSKNKNKINNEDKKPLH